MVIPLEITDSYNLILHKVQIDTSWLSYMIYIINKDDVFLLRTPFEKVTTNSKHLIRTRIYRTFKSSWSTKIWLKFAKLRVANEMWAHTISHLLVYNNNKMVPKLFLSITFYLLIIFAFASSLEGRTFYCINFDPRYIQNIEQHKRLIT